MNGIRYTAADSLGSAIMYGDSMGAFLRLRAAVECVEESPNLDVYWAADFSYTWRKISKDALRKAGYLR